MVKFVVNTGSRNKYAAKLIRVKDQEATRQILMVCDLKPDEIQVKVIELISSTVVKSGEVLKPRVIFTY